ncbi:MAG: alpha/beta fold hydrolase [Pseudomonadales bacterium]|nr:alpha/beta fold hydrolase [Pseudomonadales bacterium]
MKKKLADYHPPKGLANRHLQTILSTTGPRRFWVEKRARRLLEKSNPKIVTTKDNVRLQVWQTPSTEKGHVILLHGWEGSARSLYMLSLGNRLHELGYQVSRLNFRDHGNTRHLNREPFTSTRHQEVGDAIRLILEESTPPGKRQNNYLVGFSLGGNFALRIAIDASELTNSLDKVIAVCPLINPAATVESLSNSIIYGRYFTRRWKSGLEAKLMLYPELKALEKVISGKNLTEMHYHFAPHFSEYPDCNRYLSAYSLTGNRLQALQVNSHIIASQDDPIINIEDIRQIHTPPCLQIEITDKGGHCGYLQNYKLESWLDDRLVELIDG